MALACLGLVGYFAHHGINGRHGLEARYRLQQQLPLLESRFAGLDLERQRLRREVALLNSEGPSRDFVEEVARELLGYLLPSEVVLMGR